MRSLNLDARKDEILAMRAEGMIIAHIAADLKVGASTVKDALNKWARQGDLGYRPVLPGFEIARTSVQLDAAGEVSKTYVTQRPERGAAESIPAGHVVKGVSILSDGDGRTIAKWTKTKEGIDTTDIIETLKTAFAEVVPFAQPVPKPGNFFEDTLTLIPLADLHIGMMAWGRETVKDWDTKIAEETIGNSVARLIERTRPTKTCVVLGGGDAMHADNNENRTAKSGNTLQVDGRYQKVLRTTCRLFVRIVDTALTRHENVVVRILPGNHDEHASVAIAYFLEGWYRNEPRVTVDTDPSLFWWHRFGRTFLGATHGHAVKAKDMPAVMAHRKAEDWGQSDNRVIHTFHLHNDKTIDTISGCKVEVHDAPCPPDGWHFGMGFLSKQSLKAIVYDRLDGEIGRTIEQVR
jgi:hypothetical protein